MALSAAASSPLEERGGGVRDLIKADRKLLSQPCDSAVILQLFLCV